MEETANTGGSLSVLDDITQRVRYYAKQSILDWLKLGGLLTEAKPLVAGSWEEYVRKNAGMGLRMCQNCMQAYQRFGAGNAQVENLSISQVINLLPATDEQILKLSDGGNLADMSSREITRRLKEVREEEQEKARESMRAAAEDKALELARQKESFEKSLREKVAQAKAETAEELAAIREELAEKKKAIADLELRAQEAEASAQAATEAAIEASKDVSAQQSCREEEVRKLRRELADVTASAEALQESYNRVSEELANAESMIARGDAGRSDADILSVSAALEAVNAFLSQVGRIPYMHSACAVMENTEREALRAGILQVLEWGQKSLQAVDALDGSGGTVE